MTPKTKIKRKRPKLTRQDQVRLARARLRVHYPEGSKCFLIGEHWLRMKDALTFNRQRILNLCNALQVTPVELGMMVRQTKATVNSWLRGGKVHPAVELHLLMFERAALGLVSPMAEVPIFPTGVIGQNSNATKADEISHG